MRCVHTTIVAVENQQILHVLIVFVATSIQHAMRMRNVVIRGLPVSAIFFHIISLTALLKKNSYWAQNVWFYFLYKFRLEHFPF
jgi:hypothetical protein